jgi:hypothetical protein
VAALVAGTDLMVLWRIDAAETDANAKNINSVAIARKRCACGVTSGNDRMREKSGPRI